MTNKYITLQTRIACLSKPVHQQTIHEQLAQTIAERKRILRRLGASAQLASIFTLLQNDERPAKPVDGSAATVEVAVTSVGAI